MLYVPVQNLSTTCAASSPPLLDRTPEGPAGIDTRTRVCSVKPWAGTNWTVVGLTRCQLPPIAGVSVGIGESAASGAEKTTWTGAAPLTPRDAAQA